jgi:hypothetical protein
MGKWIPWLSLHSRPGMSRKKKVTLPWKERIRIAWDILTLPKYVESQWDTKLHIFRKGYRAGLDSATDSGKYRITISSALPNTPAAIQEYDDLDKAVAFGLKARDTAEVYDVSLEQIFTPRDLDYLLLPGNVSPPWHTDANMP